jgi:hypothetical protein
MPGLGLSKRSCITALGWTIICNTGLKVSYAPEQVR